MEIKAVTAHPSQRPHRIKTIHTRIFLKVLLICAQLTVQQRTGQILNELLWYIIFSRRWTFQLQLSGLGNLTRNPFQSWSSKRALTFQSPSVLSLFSGIDLGHRHKTGLLHNQSHCPRRKRVQTYCYFIPHARSRSPSSNSSFGKLCLIFYRHWFIRRPYYSFDDDTWWQHNRESKRMFISQFLLAHGYLATNILLQKYSSILQYIRRECSLPSSLSTYIMPWF